MARPANKPAHRGFPLQVRKTFIEPVAPTGLAAPSNPVHLVENISARKLACVLRLASCVLRLVSCVLCLVSIGRYTIASTCLAAQLQNAAQILLNRRVVMSALFDAIPCEVPPNGEDRQHATQLA